jgi:hypothetical protein
MSMPHTCRCGICGFEMSPQFIVPQGEIVNPHVLPYAEGRSGTTCVHKWVSSPDVDGTYCVFCHTEQTDTKLKP